MFVPNKLFFWWIKSNQIKNVFCLQYYFQKFWKWFCKNWKLFVLFAIKDVWETFFLVDQIKSNLECVLPTIFYIHSKSFEEIRNFQRFWKWFCKKLWFCLQYCTFNLIVSSWSEHFQRFWKWFCKELRLFALFPIKGICATFFLVDQIKSNLECVLPTILYIHSDSFRKIKTFSKILEMVLK